MPQSISDTSHKQNEKATYLRLLSQVLPKIPAGLISSYAAAESQKIAKVLPELALGCLEFYLSDPAARVDFMVNVGWHERAKIESLVQQRSISDSYGLSDYHAFYTEWIDTKKSLAGSISNLFVVYDLPQGNEVQPPWVYFGLPEVRWQRKLIPHLIQQTLSTLASELSSEVYTTLERILEVMPDSLSIPAFGSLEKRGNAHLRLGGRTFGNFEEVSAFLQLISWPGDLKGLKEWAQPFMEMGTVFSLLLDCCPEVSADIGIELWLPEEGNVEASQQVLSQLVKSGICKQEKSDQLMELLISSSQLPSSSHFLNHLKITQKEGLPLQLKAYTFIRQK